MKKLLFSLLSAVILFGVTTESIANGLADHLREKGVIADDAYYPDITVRGRLHMDAAFHDEDNVSFGDGFHVRRARLGMQGNLDPVWSFVIEYDFSEDNVTAQNVMLTANFFDGVLKMGYFKVPMGLNELTSSNHYTFIERASNSNIVTDARRLGLGFDYYADAYGGQFMIYGRGMGGKEDGDMPLGTAARVYANPIYINSLMVHVGLSAAYENRRDYDSLRFRDRPEARGDADIRLIDTGVIENVDTTFKTGIEFALQRGPFSFEAEYLMVDIDNDGNDPKFYGYHMQASYILTGESRGYRNGVFRGVTPKSVYGAWEAGIRWSAVDLNDSGIAGGKQENLTLGLNYYARSDIRFMANVIFVDVEDTPVPGIEDDAPTIFLVRGQYSF